MPTAQMKSYAEKYDVPLAKIEEFWAKAKKEYGEDFEKVSGTVKVMAKNYQKSKKNESLGLNNIEKCIVDLTEGSAKQYLEKKIEKICKCDGGASLDPTEHDKNCPARKALEKDDFDLGGDIDAAEYKMKDR